MARGRQRCRPRCIKNRLLRAQFEKFDRNRSAMRTDLKIHRARCLPAACALVLFVMLRAATALAGTDQPAATPSNLAAAMAQYRQKLEEYNKAQQSYTTAASAYWSSISSKRQARNSKRASGQQISIDDYVLDQPPASTG